MSDQPIPPFPDAPAPYPTAIDPNALRALSFYQALKRTPPIVTYTLIALNVAVFIIMAVSGLSLMEPSIEGLLRFGADFGPLTTHGQWWRMLTSTFVHIGILHIAMNMYILLVSGPFVEKLFGNVGFAVLYLLAGLGGSLTSLAWHPMTVSAGASGAIFGVYGGLLGFLAIERNAIPAGRVGPIFKNAVIFLVFNLIYSAAKSNVDMGAHVGGFVTGLLVGCVLAQPFAAAAASRMARASMVLVCGLALTAFAASRLPVVDDITAEVSQLSKVETAGIQRFNDSLDSLKAGKITGAQFGDVVDNQILPPWNAELARLQKMRLEGRQKEFADELIHYMTVRAEGWSMMGRAMRNDDSDLVKQANEKQREADAIVAGMK